MSDNATPPNVSPSTPTEPPAAYAAAAPAYQPPAPTGYSGAPAYGAPAPGTQANGAPVYGAPVYGAPIYGAPVYSAPSYAPARPTSGLAVTALVCGIAGLVLGMFIVPLLASVVAVITGHLALAKLKRTPVLGGRGMAIAGLVLGYVGAAIVVLVVLGWIVSLLFLGTFGLLPFLFAS